MSRYIGTLVFFINVFFLDRTQWAMPLTIQEPDGEKIIYWDDFCNVALEVAKSKDFDNYDVYMALLKLGFSRWALYSILQRYAKLNPEQRKHYLDVLHEHLVKHCPEFFERIGTKTRDTHFNSCGFPDF